MTSRRLGKNAEALTDAAAVPLGFQFQAVFSIESEANYNFIYWVNANQPLQPWTATTLAEGWTH